MARFEYKTVNIDTIEGFEQAARMLVLDGKSSAWEPSGCWSGPEHARWVSEAARVHHAARRRGHGR